MKPAPVPGLPVELESGTLAVEGFPVGLRVLAAAQRPDSGGVEQAVLFQQHDVIGLSVMAAPEAGSWAELATAWRATTAGVPLDACLGSAEVYLGLLADSLGDRTALAERIRPLVPEPRSGRWTPCWAISDRARSTLWELPWRDAVAVPTHRRLLAVAAVSDEAELDAWAWTDGGPGLAPLTRYLLHAAKIRYERDVLERDLPALRRVASDVDATGRRLGASVATLAERGTGGQRRAALADLRTAGRELSRLSTTADGLLNAQALLSAATDTVRFAQRNARAVTAGMRSQPGSPAVVDAYLADVVLTQAASESQTLAAASARAAEASRLADTTITGYLRDRQAELTLAQTSVLGGLLTALAAVQALAYEVPLPGPLKAPLIALLGSLAVALPVLIPRWRLHDLGRAGPRSVLPTVGFGLVGATTGWLAASAAAFGLTGAAAPPGVSLSAAGGCAAAAVFGEVMMGRRHR
jgi:hypothetical protein